MEKQLFGTGRMVYVTGYGVGITIGQNEEGTKNIVQFLDEGIKELKVNEIKLIDSFIIQTSDENMYYVDEIRNPVEEKLFEQAQSGGWF